MPQNPTRQVHALLGNLPAYQNAGFLHDASQKDKLAPKRLIWKRTKYNLPMTKFLKHFAVVCSCRHCKKSHYFQAMK